MLILVLSDRSGKAIRENDSRLHDVIRVWKMNDTELNM